MANVLIAQITYLAFMLVSLLTIFVSMFTPTWRKIILSNSVNQKFEDIPSSGIFICKGLDIGTCFSRHTSTDIFILILLVFALLTELASIGWIIASLFACCNLKQRKWFFYPLPGFSIASSLFLFLAILLFVLQQSETIEYDMNSKIGKAAYIGYSFYICCVALLFAIFTVVVGIITAFFMERD